MGLRVDVAAGAAASRNRAGCTAGRSRTGRAAALEAARGARAGVRASPRCGGATALPIRGLGHRGRAPDRSWHPGKVWRKTTGLHTKKFRETSRWTRVAPCTARVTAHLVPMVNTPRGSATLVRGNPPRRRTTRLILVCSLPTCRGTPDGRRRTRTSQEASGSGRQGIPKGRHGGRRAVAAHQRRQGRPGSALIKNSAGYSPPELQTGV